MGRSAEELMDEAELPDDPAEIAAMLEGDGEADPAATAGPKAEPEGDTPPATPEAEAPAEEPGEKDKAAAGDAPAEEPKGESPPPDEAPVLAADGKHTIPYTVLQQARDQARTESEARQQAEQRAQELEAELARLGTGGAKPGDTPGDTPSSAADDVLAGIDLDEIREELGENAANVISALADQVTAARQAHEELSRETKQRQASEEEDVRAYVQRTIDSIPVLAHWQASDPAMWASAVAMDRALQETPEFAQADAEARFTEVAKRLNGGSVDVSGQQPTPQTPTTPAADPSKPKAEAEAEAEPPPTSHAELPGGVSPSGKSEREQIEDASVLDIAARMEGMTPEQEEAFLARLS